MFSEGYETMRIGDRVFVGAVTAMILFVLGVAIYVLTIKEPGLGAYLTGIFLGFYGLGYLVEKIYEEEE